MSSGRPLAQSIELYLDRESETAVRSIWLQLGQAGFSTLHSSESQRTPHMSICVVREPQSFEPILPDITEITGAALGNPVTFSGVASFEPYKGRCVLYLAVLVSPTVACIADNVQVIAREAGIQFPASSSSSEWVPHITLSRGIKPDQLDEATAIVNRTALPSSPYIRAIVHGRGAGVVPRILCSLTPEQEAQVDSRE